MTEYFMTEYFIALDVHCATRSAKGGFLGALGKVGHFASGLTDQGTRENFVEVTCDIVGTPLDPSARISVEASLD